MPLQIKQVGLVALAALILGLLFDYLFRGRALGLSFFIYAAFLLGAFFWFFYFFKFKYNPSLVWYIVPVVFFSAMVAVRDSPLLIFWNIVLTMGLLLILANHSLGQSVKNYHLFDYIKVPVVLPLRFLAKSLASLGQLLTVNTRFKNNQRAGQVVKGVIITLPIFLVFLVLLSSADLAFGKFVSGFFSFRVNFQSFARAWWIFAAAFVWLGVYVFLLENSKDRETEDLPVSRAKYQFGKIEAGILFGALNVLFLVFVAIQFKYLFAGQDAISKLGFTYAEYARKGFFELTSAAVFSLLLIFGVEKYVESSEKGHWPVFKFLSTGLILLVLITMLSAFLRLSLYENAYGFTLSRFFAHTIIIWLAAVFVFLVYKIYAKAGETVFIYWTFLSVLAAFAVLNLVNPDGLIARKNIQRFAAEGKLDAGYLYSLSADAVPEIVKLLNMSGLKDKRGENLSFQAGKILERKKSTLSVKNWQSFNLSRFRALKLLNQTLP